jgi:hypothetical protein
MTHQRAGHYTALLGFERPAFRPARPTQGRPLQSTQTTRASLCSACSSFARPANRRSRARRQSSDDDVRGSNASAQGSRPSPLPLPGRPPDTYDTPSSPRVGEIPTFVVVRRHPVTPRSGDRNVTVRAAICWSGEALVRRCNFGTAPRRGGRGTFCTLVRQATPRQRVVYRPRG